MKRLSLNGEVSVEQAACPSGDSTDDDCGKTAKDTFDASSGLTSLAILDCCVRGSGKVHVMFRFRQEEQVGRSPLQRIFD
jgi:hypothetical protein